MTEQTSGAASHRPRFSDFAGEVKEFVECMIPPEPVRQHFRNSRIEFWKGVRTMVDLHIERIGRGGHEEKGSPVTVE